MTTLQTQAQTAGQILATFRWFLCCVLLHPHCFTMSCTRHSNEMCDLQSIESIYSSVVIKIPSLCAQYKSHLCIWMFLFVRSGIYYESMIESISSVVVCAPPNIIVHCQAFADRTLMIFEKKNIIFFLYISTIHTFKLTAQKITDHWIWNSVRVVLCAHK